MFRTDLLSIIRSLNTVFTAIGISHTIYVEMKYMRRNTCEEQQDTVGQITKQMHKLQRS